MDTESLLIIVAVLVVVAAILFLVRRGGAAPPDAIDLPPGELSTAAAEGLIDPVVSIPPEAIGAEPPAATPIEAAAGPPDSLTTLKGLGPKAAAQLNALGITRYDQLAALAGERLEAVDSRMGAFQGRIARDRWVEQAGHLAAGDTTGFEAKFGRLGG